MQFAVVSFLVIASFGIGAIDGGFFESGLIAFPESPLSLDVNDDSLSTKLVGGYRAGKNAFPFVAYVQYDGWIYCTGSLVHPRWVLTAGCLDFVGIQVVLGQYDRTEFDDSTQIFTVVEIVKLNDTRRDAALYKLSSRAKTRGLAVGVVDLVRSRRIMNRALMNELECVQVGWGYKRRNGIFKTARFLQAVGMDFVNDTEVERRGYGHFLQSGHIGTEARYTNECDFDGACFGDNGGPVVCRMGRRKPWFLAAIYSYFSRWDGCMTGIKGSKNVFEMSDWVQSTISG